MRYKVFLIDDDPIFSFTTKTLLGMSALNYDIEQYENGLEGYNALTKLAKVEEYPDLILLDINMPVMNGWEFLDEFVEWASTGKDNINIFVLTSSIASHDLQLSKQYDFIKGYITKPLTDVDIESINQSLYQQL